jgi:hypothetical protein
MLEVLTWKAHELITVDADGCVRRQLSEDRVVRS